jgi:hypothetical protein
MSRPRWNLASWASTRKGHLGEGDDRQRNPSMTRRRACLTQTDRIWLFHPTPHHEGKRLSEDVPLVIEFFDEPRVAKTVIRLVDNPVPQGHTVSWPAERHGPAVAPPS